MNKKKVLFFTSSGVGGAERVTVTIAKMLDKSRFDVSMIVTDTSDSDIAQFIPEDMKVFFLSEKHLRWSAFKKMKNVVIQESPDYVFSSLTFVIIPLLIICKFCCKGVKPIIRGQINPHSWTKLSGKLKWKGCFVEFINRLLYSSAYKVVAQTPTMRDGMIKYFGVKPEKCICLYNPIDKQTIDLKIKENSPFTEDDVAYRYVAVGRCQKQKGFDYLIKAMKAVVDDNPHSHVYIVGTTGDGTLYKNLLQLTTKLGISDHVHFEGFQSNPYKYIYNANCFVLSSRDEGLPNVLIESTYLQKQAVAFTCIPIIEEIIQDGVNGLLVEPENVNKLAEAMIRIQKLNLNKPSLYQPSNAVAFNELFL